MTNIFQEFWKSNNGNDYQLFHKSENKLTKSEIVEVQQKIFSLQKRGLPSSKIIAALQKFNSKLSEKHRAETAYWTEVKKKDTQVVAEAGEDIGISKYKVILSPNACKICRNKTQNGRKVFTQKDIKKSTQGEFVPFHPNCYCILIPWM